MELCGRAEESIVGIAGGVKGGGGGGAPVVAAVLQVVAIAAVPKVRAVMSKLSISFGTVISDKE